MPDARRAALRVPPGRYDRHGRQGGPSTAARVVALSTGGLLLLAAVAYVALQRAPEARGTVRSFEVRSQTSVRVVFTVDRPPGSAAECLVRSRAPDGLEVGRALVPVPQSPDGEGRVLVTYDLVTQRRATTGEVTGCRVTADPAGR